MEITMDDRIVLYGGTFDPVHNGHLIAARAVAEQRGYSRITLLPSSRGPHKGPAGASDVDRLKMLQLAIEGDDMFEISQIEMQRPTPSYTYDTLRELGETRGAECRIEMIIGADMLADLPNWYRADDVVKLAKFVVAARPPWDEKIASIAALLGERFGKPMGDGLVKSLCKTALIDISSSDIRQRLSEGLKVRYMLPDAVVQYINSRSLYR
jgi:nicotinate-nucleotide adenylyltransferase